MSFEERIGSEGIGDFQFREFIILDSQRFCFCSKFFRIYFFIGYLFSDFYDVIQVYAQNWDNA